MVKVGVNTVLWEHAAHIGTERLWAHFQMGYKQNFLLINMDQGTKREVSTAPYLETCIVSACQSKICCRFIRLRNYILVFHDQGHLAQSNQLVQMCQGSFLSWWTKPLCLQIPGPTAGPSAGNHSPPHSPPPLCWHKHPAENMSCAYCIPALLLRLTWLMYSLGMLFNSHQSYSDKNT